MNSPESSPRLPLLALAWLAICGFWFLQVELPALQNHSRLQFSTLLPEWFAYYFHTDDFSLTRMFVERLPFWGTAIFIWTGAWAWGRIILRRFSLQASQLEHQLLAAGSGISLMTTLVLGCGLLGLQSRFLIGVFLMLGIGGEIYFLRKQPSSLKESWNLSSQVRPHAGLLLLSTPFLFVLLWNCTSPPIDFDVREYHLQGPKEYFQAGQIQFLPHNVYTSFPYLTEMISLTGMILQNDWNDGALAGKAALMFFVPLTGLTLWAIAKRLFDDRTAWLCLLVYLSIPWNTRLAGTAFTEGGLLFYLSLTLLVLTMIYQQKEQSDRLRSLACLLGVSSGAALACKYTGLVWAIVPALAGLMFYLVRTPNRQYKGALLQPMVWFFLGILITAGPWLLKNLVQTGNPVYPLAYTLFGGADWSEKLDTAWRSAHQAPDYDLSRIPSLLMNELVLSPWQSPFLLLFGPLAFLNAQFRKAACVVLVLFVYLVLTWWMFTHRIDRFWLPCLIPLSLLAGTGMNWSDSRFWFRSSRVVLILGLVVNLAMIISYVGSPTPAGLRLATAREKVAQNVTTIAALNDQLPEEACVLFVGEAQVFDAHFEHRYNTVFDESIFLKLITTDSGDSSQEIVNHLKEPESIRKAFREQQLTHLCVNWDEILRYRLTYGFDQSIRPELFQQLVELKILKEVPLVNAVSLDALTPSKLAELKSWDVELLSQEGDDTSVRLIRLYEIEFD